MKKRRISVQKIFNLISAIFIFSCCVFYGGRFIKLYLENKEQVVIEANTLGKLLKESNIDTLKNINGEYYFNGEVNNNYVTYSGILWRVIKIGDNNVVTLVSNNSLTSLAFGTNMNYEDSYINKWMNKNDSEHSGILENNLNDMTAYLKKVDLCLNKVDDIANIDCTDINNSFYITLPSVSDYINTGASNGFLNTEENFYLANMNENDEIWYVNPDGKMNNSDGNDIYGVKVIINLKENLDLISGAGSKDDPYVVENSFGLFGSYVKLDEDIWRVIDARGDNLKLMYNDYIKDGSDTISYKYSIYSSYHDDTKYGTLAYYMNKTLLNNFSYKDIIIENNYANGYYGKENNFDYSNTLETTINTKVALISIGDIILNHELSNYFTLTSSSKNNNFIYTIQKDSNPYSKITSTASYVVPVITISKDSLEGTGTLIDPLRLVNNNE